MYASSNQIKSETPSVLSIKMNMNITGARVAAQLVGLAGGLIALSKIPACNIQVRKEN
jgi:RNA processing factor Prp31